MWSAHVATADPMVEARERMNIISYLNEIRGTEEPDRQRLLDTMSSVLTHEQGVGRMYWQYTQQTGRQELKDVWQRFGKETEVHRLVAERVIIALGGDPSYKSSLAREHEKISECFHRVEAQGTAGDLTRLGNLIMSESISKLQWKGMFKLARTVKDPSMAKLFWDAARLVERDKEEHVNWNTTMFGSYEEKYSAGQ